MRKTVNLSKTRAVSRQKRAKKAVSLLKENFSEDVKVSQELNQEIWSRGATKPPRKVTVEEIEGVLYPVEDIKQQKQETSETNEEDENSSSESDENYNEVVDGNIGDVKEAVENMEDPDYDKLIEAEEQGKDRKTLKEWFESQK